MGDASEEMSNKRNEAATAEADQAITALFAGKTKHAPAIAGVFYRVRRFSTNHPFHQTARSWVPGRRSGNRSFHRSNGLAAAADQPFAASYRPHFAGGPVAAMRDD